MRKEEILFREGIKIQSPNRVNIPKELLKKVVDAIGDSFTEEGNFIGFFVVCALILLIIICYAVIKHKRNK